MKKTILAIGLIMSLVACKKTSVAPTPVATTTQTIVDSVKMSLVTMSDSTEIKINGVMFRNMFANQLMVEPFYMLPKGSNISVRVKSNSIAPMEVSEYYMSGNTVIGGPVKSSCTCLEYTYTFIVQ